MVAAHGGPSDFLSASDKYLAKAPIIVPYFIKGNIKRKNSNTANLKIAEMDVRAIGNVVVELGGGRKRAQDPVDHGVGLSAIKGIGDTIAEGEAVLMIHANSQADVDKAVTQLDRAITFSESVTTPPSVILECVSSDNKSSK